MYIWILLATIMVALSFFNTSPREDKASVFTEIKASTFINRFRAEHMGYFRTVECEVLDRFSRYDNKIIPIPEHLLENLGYTSLASNLPIGYSKSNSTIYHAIYCFDRDLREEGAALTKCNAVRRLPDGSEIPAYRYLFSFSQIDERWISKTTYSVTLPDTQTEDYPGEVVKISAPVPSFSNYLAKDLHGIKNTGWMYCADNKCYLVGRSSVQTLYDKTVTKNEYKKQDDGTYSNKKEDGKYHINDSSRNKYIALHLPVSDIVHSDEKFKEICVSKVQNAAGQQVSLPCMFSAEKFKTSDIGGHCSGLKKNANNN